MKKIVCRSKIVNSINEAYTYLEDKDGCGVFRSFRSEARIPKFTLPDSLVALDKKGKTSQLVKRIKKRLEEIRDSKGIIIKKAYDPFKSDLFNMKVGDRRNVSKSRLLVLKELLVPLVRMSDTLTGVLPFSNVTTLSDQCNLTTFGQALYDEYGEKLVDEVGNPRYLLKKGEKASKKKSISRLSRLLDWLETCGYIKRHYFYDKKTGANMPLIIELTDNFYFLCGENPKTLHNARSRSIRNHIHKKTMPKELINKPVCDVIVAMRKIKIKEVSEQRQEYRDKKRESNKVSYMDAIELRNYAGKIVKKIYGDEILKTWTVDQFSHKVERQIDRIYNKNTSHYSDTESSFNTMIH
jgi:hypothetical protein